MRVAAVSLVRAAAALVSRAVPATSVMVAAIRPEPTEEEREAIRSALEVRADRDSAWAEEALREGVDPPDSDP